jgi:hypothetical protein
MDVVENRKGGDRPALVESMAGILHSFPLHELIERIGEGENTDGYSRTLAEEPQPSTKQRGTPKAPLRSAITFGLTQPTILAGINHNKC